MAVKSYLVTLDGTSGQSLYGTLFPSGAAGDANDPAFGTMLFQADKANTNEAYIGGKDTTVSSSAYGRRLDPGDTSANSVVELIADGCSALRLSDFKISGTAGEKIAIIGIVR
jgi:hypothetical protein